MRDSTTRRGWLLREALWPAVVLGAPLFVTAVALVLAALGEG